tara:strand:+ start:2741 stop:2935 length:195 start_codon:yes stop_codon:yes gene_type:complete
MNLEEALALSKKFPKDKTVPKKIADAIRKSSGKKKDDLMQIGEGIILQCETREDKKIVMKHLMN